MSEAVILTTLAEALEAATSSIRQRLAVIQAETKAASRPSTLKAVDRARARHPNLGSRQEQIIEILDEVGPEGANTGVISRRIGYDQPNVYLALRKLVELGFVEKDDGTDPHTYRLKDF